MMHLYNYFDGLLQSVIDSGEKNNQRYAAELDLIKERTQLVQNSIEKGVLKLILTR